MSKRYLSAAAAAALSMVVGVLMIAVGFEPNPGQGQADLAPRSANSQCGTCEVFQELSEPQNAPPVGGVLASFRVGFDLWKGVCAETVAACRSSTAPPASRLCAAGAETQGPLGRLGRLAGDVSSLAARCRGLACPQGDCTAGATLRQVLGNAAARLTRWQAESRLTEADLKLVETALKSAESDAIQVVALAKTAASELPSATQLTTMADQFWRHEAAFRSIAARLSGPGGASGGPGPWRLAEIATSLGATANTLRAAAEVKPNKDRQRLVGSRWSALGNAIGEVLVNLHNLDVELTVARTELVGPATNCASAQGAGNSIAAELAQARGQLEQCLAQVGCAETSPRATGATTGVGESLDQLSDDMVRALDAVRLSDAGPVSISSDETSYGQGDAIAVHLEGAQNKCLVKGGWLGLFKLDQSARLLADPVTKVDIAPGGETNPVLIGAPLETGAFALALFGTQRPETPLGVKAITVSTPRAGCRGFSGRWQSDFGDLITTVRGGQLRGTYRRTPEAPAGFLMGTLKDRVFTGTWRSELGAGGTRLVLSKDGNSFSGTWSKKLGEVDGHGLWQGKCSSKP